MIDSGGIRVVLWSLYQDFEMAAAQARPTDNHEHPRIVWPSSPMRKPWILMKQDYRGVAGLCFRSITNTPAPFVPPNVWTPENARQFWLSRESSLSYASLPSPEFSMRLLPIRVALKTFSLEEWFWRLVFVGVVCDFLYLGWFIVRSLRAH